MTNNSNGKFAVTTKKSSLQERMEYYDSLPKNLREVIANAPYQLRINNLDKFRNKPRSLKQTIKSITIDSALATYGKNYPIETIK